MTRSMQLMTAAAFAAFIGALVPVQAETVMQQCGQQYQAAKAAGTLSGATWTQFRKDCAAKLKAQPVSTGAPAAAAPAGSVPATAPTNPLKPESTVAAPAPASTSASAPAKAATPATGGRAAMLARERQCGAEWKAQKVTLVAQTPGLTWPKYWSQCNTRLKAAGQ